VSDKFRPSQALTPAELIASFSTKIRIGTYRTESKADYIQQCRNDWEGVKTYPKLLSEKQDIKKVDAIAGATWSYNTFKASVNEALKNAK
jgi:major membrane immunogen (membrane-anchored lipoprotein)